MKKSTLLCLMMLGMALAGCSRSMPTEIRLGMLQTEVEENLASLGALDISDGISVATMDGSDPSEDGPLSGRMWFLEEQDLTIETGFTDGKLNILNVWDWRNQKFDRYHHLLKFDEVNRITIWKGSTKYEATVVKSHND